MKTGSKMVIAVLAMAVTSFAMERPALASGIAIDFGNVAFAYSDGYWDKGHQWHRWGAHDRDRFRHERAADYHGWRHTRDKDHGWHDDDHDHDHGHDHDH